MKKLLPIFLILLGTGSGVGAGLALRPDRAEMVEVPDCGPQEPAMMQAKAAPDDSGDATEGPASQEYVKLNNQFVVPVVTRGMVESLVVVSLSVEIDPGNTEAIYRHEPKLRDSFLEVLFDHANMGGFQGEFTDTNKLDVLKQALLEVAHKVIGPAVTGVLITDIARQDS